MPLTLVPPRRGYSPNWRIRGTVRGLTVNETTGTADKALADAIRIKREAALLEESVLGPRTSRRFSEAAISYAEGISGRSQLNAIIGYPRRDGSSGPCLIADFGALLCSEINQAAVDRVIRQRFKDRSPATMQRNFLTPLIAVLNWAAKREWCNPPRFERPAQPRPRTLWLDYVEADRLLEAAPPHLYRLILFLLLTGARIGEALSLEWADVDLKQGWAVFRNTKRGKRAGQAGEDRGVPLHPQLVVMLANLGRPKAGSGHVFLTALGKPYGADENGSGARTSWRSSLRRAGLDPALHMHDLRHTFATWLMLARVPDRVREEIMGHAASRISQRYAHVPRPELLEAVNLLPTRAKSVQQAFQYPGKLNDIKDISNG
jgi:integrase